MVTMKKNNREHDNSEDIEELAEEIREACQACGGELKAEKVNLEEFEGGKLYLMENVHAYVCQECGEVWVPEPVLAEFEKMIDTAKQHSGKTKAKKIIKKSK